MGYGLGIWNETQFGWIIGDWEIRHMQGIENKKKDKRNHEKSDWNKKLRNGRNAKWKVDECWKKLGKIMIKCGWIKSE